MVLYLCDEGGAAESTGSLSFCDCAPLCEFYAGGQAVMAQLLGAGASDPDIEARLD